MTLYQLIKIAVILLGAIEIPVGMYCAFCLGKWTENHQREWLEQFFIVLCLSVGLYITDYFLWFWAMENMGV